MKALPLEGPFCLDYLRSRGSLVEMLRNLEKVKTFAPIVKAVT
jgi:hypothetical protein